MRRCSASFSVWSSSTSSAARCSAGIDGSPAALYWSHFCSVSCHSSDANRKPGDTVLPALMRTSVASSASVTNFMPIGCSSTTSSSGSRPWCRPELRSSFRQASACPLIRSLSISSNTRAAGTFVDQFGHRRDRRTGFRFDLELELGGEAHHAQHAHRVFAVALFRHANDAQDAVADVGDAAVVVQHGLVGRVVIHGVDGEVAAHGVFVLRPEAVVAQHAAVFILRRVVGAGPAEGRHFQQFLAKHHVHDLEAAADDERAPEQALDLLGRCVGGDIEVFRFHAQQQVAHGAAHHKRFKAGFLQGLGHAHGVWRQQPGIDPVFVRTQDIRFGRIGGPARRL